MAGNVTITAYLSPSLSILPSRPLGFGIQLGEAEAQTLYPIPPPAQDRFPATGIQQCGMK